MASVAKSPAAKSKDAPAAKAKRNTSKDRDWQREKSRVMKLSR